MCVWCVRACVNLCVCFCVFSYNSSLYKVKPLFPWGILWGDWGGGRGGLSQRGVDILQYSGLFYSQFPWKKGQKLLSDSCESVFSTVQLWTLYFDYSLNFNPCCPLIMLTTSGKWYCRFPLYIALQRSTE